MTGSTIGSGSGIDWTGPVTPFVGVELSAGPTGMRLRIASATPSAGEVRLSLFLPHAAAARVAVYDLSGRHIRTLSEGWTSLGRTDLAWDGRSAEGISAEPGLYFVRADCEGRVATERLVRVR